MTIGAALLLIAAGAILRFAINTVSTHGINVHTIGDILMIVDRLEHRVVRDDTIAERQAPGSGDALRRIRDVNDLR